MEEIDIYTYGNDQITIPTPNNNIIVINGYPFQENAPPIEPEPEDPQPQTPPPEPEPEPDTDPTTFQLKLINFIDTRDEVYTTINGPYQAGDTRYDLYTNSDGIGCLLQNISYHNYFNTTYRKLKQVNFNIIQTYNYKKIHFTVENTDLTANTRFNVYDTPENLLKLINVDTAPYLVQKLNRVGYTEKKENSSALTWTTTKPNTAYVCGYTYNQDKLTLGRASTVTADIYINLNLVSKYQNHEQFLYFFNDSETFKIMLEAVKNYNMPIIGFSKLTNTIPQQQ